MASEQLVAETTSAAEHSGVLGTFGVRADLFLAQLINFALVLLVLWKFVYKPIFAMLDARKEKIAQSMRDADAIAERAKASEQEHEAILVAARKEAQALIESAMKETDVRKNAMMEGAKREVERVIRFGKEKLDQEHDASMLKLRKDVADLAVRAAAKIVTNGLDEKKSQSLAEEVVRKLT